MYCTTNILRLDTGFCSTVLNFNGNYQNIIYIICIIFMYMLSVSIQHPKIICDYFFIPDINGKAFEDQCVLQHSNKFVQLVYYVNNTAKIAVAYSNGQCVIYLIDYLYVLFNA